MHRPTIKERGPLNHKSTKGIICNICQNKVLKQRRIKKKIRHPQTSPNFIDQPQTYPGISGVQ